MIRGTIIIIEKESKLIICFLKKNEELHLNVQKRNVTRAMSETALYGDVRQL